MSEHVRKPDWLKIRLGGNEQFTKTKALLSLIVCTPFVQVENARTWENAGAGELLRL